MPILSLRLNIQEVLNGYDHNDENFNCNLVLVYCSKLLNNNYCNCNFYFSYEATFPLAFLPNRCICEFNST